MKILSAVDLRGLEIKNKAKIEEMKRKNESDNPIESALAEAWLKANEKAIKDFDIPTISKLNKQIV